MEWSSFFAAMWVLFWGISPTFAGGLDVAYTTSRLPTSPTPCDSTQCIQGRIHLALAFLQRDFTSQHIGAEALGLMSPALLKLTLGKYLPDRILADPGSIVANLDMMRTLDESVGPDGTIHGSGCRLRALMFSELLKRSGIPKERIHIVETVRIEDFNSLCPNAGKPLVMEEKNGLQGHVFVALDFPDGSQRLINPSQATDVNNADQGYPVDFTNYNTHALASSVPKEALTPYLSKTKALIVFKVAPYGSQGEYAVSKRANIVASGKTDGDGCRFGPVEQLLPQVEKLVSPKPDTNKNVVTEDSEEVKVVREPRELHFLHTIQNGRAEPERDATPLARPAH